MAKRDQTPPYEIMRSRPGGTAPTGSAGGGSSAGSESDEAGSASDYSADSVPTLPRKAPWWVGSSAPLVLRVPRGLAILIVLGVLVLIVVAYGVGSIRGAASAQPDPNEQGLGDRSGPTGYYMAEEAYDGPTVDVPSLVIEDKDVRVPGMWYIRLMESAKVEDCRNLATFMASKGVAIQIVKRNNGRFVAYVADRAYATDEKDSEPARYYLGWIKDRGRELKIHNGGKGTDLSSAYYAQCVKN